MIIYFHKNFEKQYKKLSKKNKQKFKQKRNIFLRDPFDPRLNNHALQGKYKNYRSINITADLRALYRVVGKQEALFVSINTHSNLYK